MILNHLVPFNLKKKKNISLIAFKGFYSPIGTSKFYVDTSIEGSISHQPQTQNRRVEKEFNAPNLGNPILTKNPNTHTSVMSQLT